MRWNPKANQKVEAKYFVQVPSIIIKKPAIMFFFNPKWLMKVPETRQKKAIISEARAFNKPI